MIRAVEIQNWRAYDNVTIDLSAAVVFFVAPNGVGKSSLVEAVRWGLLGQPAPRKAARAVRHGSDEAVVTIEFSTDDGSPPVRVTRTLSPTGRTTLTALRGDEQLTQDDYEELLRTAWGADLHLLDSLMFTDPEIPVARSAFPVRDHLASVLGVTPLLEAASGLVALGKEASGRVSNLRTEIAELEQELVAVEETSPDREGTLQEVSSERERVTVLVEREEQRVALAGRWEHYRAQAQAHNAESAEVLAGMAAFVEVDPLAPAVSLAAADAEATERLEAARDAQAAHQIEAARAETATDLLSGPTDVCPTCLRPLTEHERNSALERHGETVGKADSGTERLDEAVAEARSRLQRLNEYARQLAALQPPIPPTEDDPGPEAATLLAALREQYVALAERAGQLQALAASEASRQRLAERITEIKHALAVSADEEQMIASTTEVLNKLADRTLTDRIDPLISELSARWKILFGTAGLTLAPSGELLVENPDGNLAITDLSGGERATAMLVARLLITAATTRIPSVWFDEPLEHLDPRRRAAVAKTLVRAGQTQTVAQVVVTTYEDRIARQLAAADPDAVRIVHADKLPTS